MTIKPKISAILITKNDAHTITACLESIKWVDEIIVVDDNSTDDTVKICRDFGAKVAIETWSGFGAQKTKALNLTQYDWVLSIDSDERVPPKLREEILATISQDNTATAYHVRRQNYFYNRHMKYTLGARHDKPIRLFNKTTAQFSDHAIHERVIPTGKVGELKNVLHHYPYTNLEEILYKNNLYSSIGVQRLIDNKVRPSIIKAFGHAAWVFTKIYFLQLGFLDGWPGFLIAFSNFECTFYRYAKLLERCKYQKTL